MQVLFNSQSCFPSSCQQARHRVLKPELQLLVLSCRSKLCNVWGKAAAIVLLLPLAGHRCCQQFFLVTFFSFDCQYLRLNIHVVEKKHNLIQDSRTYKTYFYASKVTTIAEMHYCCGKCFSKVLIQRICRWCSDLRMLSWNSQRCSHAQSHLQSPLVLLLQIQQKTDDHAILL